MRNITLALCSLFILACSGSGTEPKPVPVTPKNPVARIELRTNDALVLTNTRTALSTFIVRAYDKDGVVVPNPQLVYTLPAGWTQVNGQLVAPIHEQRGTLHISADTLNYNPNKSASLVPGLASAVDSVVNLTAGLDLRPLHMRADYTCIVTDSMMKRLEDGVHLDSIQYRTQVDTTAYRGDSSFHSNFVIGDDLPLASFRTNGFAVRYWANATQDTLQQPNMFGADVIRQVPDTIYIARGDEWLNQIYPMVKISETPLRYTTRNWCPGNHTRYSPNTSFTLEQVN